MRITKSAVALAGAFLVALLCANPITASAQAWPAKSVRIVVPFVPGGGSDIQGRLFSKKFQESMGQSFVVDNRGGAGGMIGAEIVTRLNAEVQKALNSADMRDAITKDGGEPKGSTPDELAAYFKREVDKYAKVIRAGKVQAE